MAKPIPTLKKPSAPLPLAAMAAFVSGEKEGAPILAPSAPPELAVNQDQPLSVPTDEVEAAAEPSATVHSIDGGKGPLPRRTKTAAKSGRRLETRSDGSVTRKVTVYLSPELDKQLSLHAVTNELDRSDVVAEALARYLRKSS